MTSDIKTTAIANLQSEVTWRGQAYQPGTQSLPLDLAIALGLVQGFDPAWVASGSFYLLGGAGPRLIAGTSAVTGQFYKLVFLANSQITEIQGLPDDYASVSVPALFELDAGALNTITSVQLASGTCVAYQS